MRSGWRHFPKTAPPVFFSKSPFPAMVKLPKKDKKILLEKGVEADPQ